MEFCKVFNVKIVDMDKGVFCLIVIIYYQDKLFSFDIKILFVLYYLKKVVKLQLGVNNLGKEVVGLVIVVQVKEIVEVKMKDLNVILVEGVM